MVIAAVAAVNVPADHKSGSNSLDRLAQFATADVLHPAAVPVGDSITVVQGWLMRHEHVDADGNRRVHVRKLCRLFHEGPQHELVGPWSCPNGQRAASAVRVGNSSAFINQDLKVRR